MTEERMIPVPGGNLFAVSEGDGPPMVLPHAGVVASRRWEPFVPRVVDAGERVALDPIRAGVLLKQQRAENAQ